MTQYLRRCVTLTIVATIAWLATHDLAHAQRGKAKRGKQASAAPAERASEPPPLVSPEVAADGKITFRLKAPRAASVLVESSELESLLGGPRKDMVRAADGLWSLTIGPVPPGIYDYWIVVDGVKNTDPSSTKVFGNRQGSRGYVEVPGPSGAPRVDEWRDVPHGTLTVHWYNSPAAGGARRRLHVYAPPSYASSPDRAYPALYLLHGSGDNDSHWSLLGQANVIADNLAADGKAAEMIIVMPDGHVPVEQVAGEDREGERARANAAFEREMIETIIPLVERNYRVAEGPANRALAGLSMGGAQTLRVGLNHCDQFAWLGAFSAGAREPAQFMRLLPADAREANQRLKLFWIACGRDDRLVEGNRLFVDELTKRDVSHEYHETSGGHRWSVWRAYLTEFMPRLFEK